MAKLYSISVCPVSMNVVDPARVEKELAPLGDWIRFNPWQWFIFTQHSKLEIVDATKRGLAPDDHVLVVSVQAEVAAGWTATWVWGWLNEKMNAIIMAK